MTAARLGIGLAAVGRPAYITTGRSEDLGPDRSPEDLAARTHALLDAAYAAGVRYVDVARSYGRAEEFVASWLSGHAADDVEVGSKWGYRYVGGWRADADVHEVKDHSLTAFHEQWPLTERLLGRRLGRYLVHSAALDTGVLADVRVHRALAGLRERGVRVGISSAGPHQADAVRAALEVDVDGAPLFTAFQVTWNLLEPSVGPAAAEAGAAGAQVVVKEVVANGRLAPRSDIGSDIGSGVGSDDGSAGVRCVASAAARAGTTVDRLAVAAALAQPWAWRVLSGAVTPGQVTSHVAAADVVVDDGLLAEVLAGAAEEPTAYWRARSQRSWT